MRNKSHLQILAFNTEHNSQQVYTYYGPTLNPETYYDKEQRFVDNRVNCTYTDNVYTYYSYDPHGNVEWIKQSIVGFKPCYIGYEYDLISNKITKVKYNEGSESDRFFHRYSYDEDNRLVLVETSRDNYLWEKDGTYKYYPHGPLKSLEIGEDNLQKVDYSYTIQGWLKGINYPSEIGTPEEEFPNDLYVTSLQYFAKNPADPNDKGDYLSRATVLNHDDNHAYSNSRLYNGNITSWTSKYDLSSLPQIVQNGFKYNVTTGFEFSYDKLNRLKQSEFRFKNSTGWDEINNNYNQYNQYNTSYTYDPNGNITHLSRNAFGSSTEQVKMDDLTYEYPTDLSSNKLNSVTETLLPGSNSNGQHNDITGVHNYNYDEIGNLVSDMNASGEGIASIEWNVYGKIASVTHDANSALPDLEFIYDATGNRIIKKCLYKNPASVITYYYIRDVQGNIMSIYSGTSVPGTQPETFIVEEQPIYGSSRLGTLATGATVTNTKTSTGSVYYRQLGQKSYELTDYLGNVRAVISDYVVKLDATTLSAQLSSVNDYYPFGMGMPGRLYNTEQYRFGFGGMEKDDEVSGAGATYDFGGDSYDARIGRRKSPDPEWKKGPGISPYSTFFNNPILHNDTKGRWPEETHTAIITAVAIKLEKDYGIILSQNQINWMIAGSIDADKLDNQATERSFIHYMQDPKVTKEQAVKDANNWIKTNINEYASGNEDEAAYMALGRATHTMMDATSPTHTKQNADGTYEPIENDLPGLDAKTVAGVFIVPGYIPVAGYRVYKHVSGEGKEEAKQQMDKSVGNVVNVIGDAFKAKNGNGGMPNVTYDGGTFDEVVVTPKK